jgi:tetratricopeptide (TPR) repeat protein
MNFGGSLQEAAALVKAGKMREAVEQWEREADPVQLKSRLLLLADACAGLGLQKEGLKLIHKVLELDPQDVVALCSAGETFVDSGELDQALPYFLHATRVAPAHAAAWSGLGYLLLKQKKQKESLACLHKARELAPEDAMTLNRLGLSFLSDQRIPEAVSCFRDSIRVRPDFALAWSNLSVAWRQANQIRQAIDACEQALKIQPNEAATWTNLGVLLQEENAVDEALVAYRKALEVDRHFHLAHLNEGIALLLKGELPLGWLKYEYRWLLPQAQKLRHSGQPFWRGDASLLGRTILLHSDQGFGDTIQFLRYAPVLASMGAMVHVEVEAPLADLAGGVAGVVAVTKTGEAPPPFDLHCPFLSLPLGCRTTTASIPGQIPYLKPSKNAISKWRHLERSPNKLNVGLVWRGNPNHDNDQNRSVSLELFRPILDCEFCAFFNLQWNLSAEESQSIERHPNIQNPISQVRNFEDTAAIILHLDLVISVDTAVAHLAGALGKPVWILLPFSPDWRWMLHRTDSPWYPTMRLYRQPRRGEWRIPISQVFDNLKTLASCF